MSGLSSDYNDQMDRLRRYAHLIEKQSGKAIRPYRFDGYVNMMTRYGTQKDSSEHFRFVPEDAVPDELLTMYYEGNGLFAKIIDAPAEESVKHGFKLKDVSDQKVEDFYIESLDELDWNETAITAMKWMRLFGGSMVVMLINDGRGLDEPVDWKNVQSIDALRVFDRSVIQPDYTTLFNYDPRDPFSARGSRLGMPEYYQVFSKYGSFTVHDSRCLIFQNGVLPENTTNSIYQLWGVPEYIRLNKAIQDAEIAHRSAPKLLDRSVQPIYKMQNLSAELATEEGENKVLRRLQTIDMARGLLNSLVIDADGEDYDFKTFQFQGINDVVTASCSMLSAVSNIPQTILFGSGVGGLSTTDDTSMENYYNYIERYQNRVLRSNLRYLLSIIFQAGLATGEIDEIPRIKIEFNPLWSLSELEQADLETKREQAKLTRAQTAQVYVDMQAIDPSEVRQKLADSDEFDVENMLDEYDEDELLVGLESQEPDDITSENAWGDVTSEGGVLGERPTEGEAPASFSTEVSVEEHNADPDIGGQAPAAAPAATKLPQDMSQEEVETIEETEAANADADDASENRESVGVLVVSDGKILVGTRHNDNGYGLICGPGGHVEPGETPEQAAVRETQEEFGITPTSLILYGKGPVEEDTGLSPYLYLCTDFEGATSSTDLEMVNPRFLSLEELADQADSLFEPFRDELYIITRLLESGLEFLDGTEAYSIDGGPGSGNHGHEGVSGKVGGSAPKGSNIGGEKHKPISKRSEPAVKSSKNFNDYVKQNNLKPIYRGFSAPSKQKATEYSDMLKQGKAPNSGANSSALGSGVYFTDDKVEADGYASRRKQETGDKETVVATCALDVGAKVMDLHDLEIAKADRIEEIGNEIKAVRKTATDEELDALYDERDKLYTMGGADYGRYIGCDAMYDPFTNYTVVINQNALVVKDEFD